MPPRKDVSKPVSSARQPSAATPTDREMQMIQYADALAEKQLLDGTASTQVITHYLKLGTSTEALQQEKLRNENLRLEAQIAAAASMQTSEEMLNRVMVAIRKYHGEEEEDD